MEKKRVSVFVAGQRFNIITDEDEKYVIDVAAKIDARITSLTISQNIPRERAAVLTALDFADDNEQDKRAIAEIKEQIKDYLTQISQLSEENTALNAENNQLKRELAALSDQQAAGEASMKEQLAQGDAALKEQKTAYEAALKEAQDVKIADEKEKEALRTQIRDLKDQIEQIKAAPAPIPEEAPPVKEEPVTPDDDLFFGAPAQAAPTPQKEKKNRHEHSHVNPYKQQFMSKKNEQKGYTQQRKYSLFDKDE